MNHLCAFSGIGGWAWAAGQMGWNHLGFVEKEPFCHEVLKKNFPNVPIYDDIFTFTAKPFRGRVDVLTGSTPCQPFSQAGKREGSNDERHLFPELLRVVEECEPRWIVIENVLGLLNIEVGQVFDEYHTSLESKGYAVQSFCVPASALGAWHRRDRLWIVATRDRNADHRELARVSERGFSERQNAVAGRSNSVSATNTDHAGIGASASGVDAKRRPFGSERQHAFVEPGGHDTDVVADTDSPRPQGGELGRAFSEREWASQSAAEPISDVWKRGWLEYAFRTCVRRSDDGFSAQLEQLGSRDNRAKRLKALGNAIVPQIALEIFQAIAETEQK